MEEEKAIATGDWHGNIAVWSIAKYLEENQEGNEAQEIVIATQGYDTAKNDNSDQNGILLEP